MKWNSSFLSGLRGQMGKQIVGAAWKGRNYFRGYVVPSNPKTDEQTHNRNMMAYIVAWFQANVKGDAPTKAAWNKEALPGLISGFNLFTKYGRSTIETSITLAHASFEIVIEKSMIPADRLAVMAEHPDTPDVYHLPTTKRGLGTYTSADFSGWTPAAGDIIHIADTKVLVGADTESTAKLYKSVSKWSKITTNGVTAVAPMVLT